MVKSFFPDSLPKKGQHKREKRTEKHSNKLCQQIEQAFGRAPKVVPVAGAKYQYIVMYEGIGIHCFNRGEACAVLETILALGNRYNVLTGPIYR